MQRVFTINCWHSTKEKTSHGFPLSGNLSQRSYSHAKTKKRHMNKAPSAALHPPFVPPFVLGRKIGALTLQMGAVLHLSSFLVCCIPRLTKTKESSCFVHPKKLSQQWKKSENIAEFCIWTKIFTIFQILPFFNPAQVFYSRLFCSNLDSLTSYSTSILRLSKMLISLQTRSCKVLLGIEVTGNHLHNQSQQPHENSLGIYNSW